MREHEIGRRDAVLVAVSGGADSMALLRVLLGIGQRLGVAHVHHGLRGEEADSDQVFVGRRAAELGVPFHARRVAAARPAPRPRGMQSPAVRSAGASRESPEARARRLRYAALEELRALHGYWAVLTAHTRDDQAETLLLRLVRGTGVAGLSGIEPRSMRGRLLRPVLRIGRAMLRGELGESSGAYREDSSNSDPAVPRNRLRAEVLPLLEEIHRGAGERLAALAGRAREARQPSEAEVGRLLERAVRGGNGGFWVDAKALLEAPVGLRMGAIAALLRRAGLAERVTSDHLQRVDGFLAHAGTGKALSLPRDHALYRSREGFWLGNGSAPGEPSSV